MTTRWINPSDCVDMDCDARRKFLVTDADGTFLGPRAGTMVLSRSEYGWDGAPVWGLGDFRIPKTMLTNPDGSRINVTEKYPYKGWIHFLCPLAVW